MLFAKGDPPRSFRTEEVDFAESTGEELQRKQLVDCTCTMIEMLPDKTLADV